MAYSAGGWVGGARIRVRPGGRHHLAALGTTPMRKPAHPGPARDGGGDWVEEGLVDPEHQGQGHGEPEQQPGDPHQGPGEELPGRDGREPPTARRSWRSR